VRVRFPASELARLDALAARLQLTRSGVLRLAVDKLGERVYDTDSAARNDAPAGTVERAATSSDPTPVPAASSRPRVVDRPHSGKSALDDIDALLAELDD